jgi:cytochrome c-type biogenesis protein CcmH/NrfG
VSERSELAGEEETREHLEEEQDFLLRSLDDLEAERVAGGIDEESYRALHDDYTARAAAVIRALRDGIDARPPAPSLPRGRRAAVIAAIAVFAVGAAVALASALGGRGAGETSSGNTGQVSGGAQNVNPRRDLERAVQRDPPTVGNRLLLARFLEEDDDLAGAVEQYDEVIRLDPENTEALAQSGRVLYLVAAAAPEQAGDLVDEARSRLDTAIEIDAEYPDARFFRAIILANEFQDFATAQSDLQRYLILAPEGQFVDQARQLLADVTAALEPRTTTTT